MCDNNGKSAISLAKTALINNKCVFQFSASGVVNGNSISRYYTCDVSSVYVENGNIYTIATTSSSRARPTPRARFEARPSQCNSGVGGRPEGGGVTATQ